MQKQGAGEEAIVADFEACRSECRKAPVYTNVERSDEETQRLLDQSALYSGDEGIRQGIVDAEKGGTRPASEFFTGFEAELGIFDCFRQ